MQMQEENAYSRGFHALSWTPIGDALLNEFLSS